MRKCRFQLALVFGYVLVSSGLVSAQATGDKAIPDYVEIAGRRCFTDGPVRHVPVKWADYTYIGSDDGLLYCFDADAKLVWKFRGGPSNRKVLGAGRLISAWNVSGGPVVHEDKVYFAAGMWPVMGVFVYALDAKTGDIVWKNDSANSIWQSELVTEGKGDPSFEASFISISPNGQCSVEGGKLVVPCGRSRPAYFDLTSGKLLSFNQGGNRPWVEKHVGELSYPDYDRIAEAKRGCFSKDASADAIFVTSGVRSGYCLVLGAGNVGLVKGLIAHSMLRLIVIDTDAGNVDALRTQLVEADVYGTRASVHQADAGSWGLPPYFASLVVVSDDTEVSQLSPPMFEAIRPYGGTLCLPKSQRHLVNNPPIAKTKTSQKGNYVLLRREGALPGADDWSHEHANASNTRFSRDDVVRSPFGVLWFGGPSSQPRYYYENHRLYGLPQVAGGRMFIEGPKLISCFDTYTGRKLWEWRPPETDKENWDLDSHAANDQLIQFAFEPMAGRLISSIDAAYVVSDQVLYALDAETGQPLEGFSFQEKSDWGAGKLHKDVLYLPCASRVLALDRHTGEIKWQYTEGGGTLAISDERIFCITYPNAQWPDRFSNAHSSPKSRHLKGIAKFHDLDRLKRRGIEDTAPQPQLVALHSATGKVLWKQNAAPSPRLAYCKDQDIIMAVPYYGMAKGYRCTDGKEAWKGLTNLHTVFGDELIVRSGLKSFILQPYSKQPARQVTSPLSASTGPYPRNILQLTKTGNGCGPPIASRHVMTFRSGTAAYFDISDDPGLRSGVVNLGGFRSSCNPSLIPANGLLVAPNAVAGGCRCRYPLSMSAAFVHMPEMEKWGSYGSKPAEEPVRRIGINLGAPGDRMSQGGTLWLDYPSVGGPSPVVEITTEPSEPEWFRFHSSRVIRGTGLNWVQSSGAKNLKSLTVNLNREEPSDYTVRVFYARSAEDDPHALYADVDVLALKGGSELTVNFTSDRYVCGVELAESGIASKLAPLDQLSLPSLSPKNAVR